MKHLMLIIGLSLIFNISYPQNEQKILNQALQNYRKELPNLQKLTFKKLKKIDRSKVKINSCEFKNYHFIIIPMFKLKDEYVQYHKGNTFASYIDFGKLHNDFEVFVFKDTIYKGSLHYSNFDNSYFSVQDTNGNNKSTFNEQYSLAKQIIGFQPDMVFYPECPIFLFFLKDGKLYVGKGEKQLQTLENILPVDEFIEKNPSFLKELKDNKHVDLRNYIEINK